VMLANTGDPRKSRGFPCPCGHWGTSACWGPLGEKCREWVEWVIGDFSPSGHYLELVDNEANATADYSRQSGEMHMLKRLTSVVP
jgi:hypothetical protein